MKKFTIFFVAIVAILFAILFFDPFSTSSGTKDKLTYTQLITDLNNNNITKIKITPDGADSVNSAFLTGYQISGEYSKGNNTFVTHVLINDPVINQIHDLASQNKMEVVIDNPKGNLFIQMLIQIAPFLVISIVGWMFISRSSMRGGSGGLPGMDSHEKIIKNTKEVTFKSVAGYKNEKQELEEVIDFLRFPKKFTDMGAKIPKGVLLSGPPGTGKTLLAKAVSGEAGVPFITMSGSEFLEVFVGVGASRVRKLFKKAKENAPCVIFIDEIDAIGRQRGAGFGGGNDEREQTLNQILVEMDGFNENTGIIIIAATNRPDVLDPALVRPGRFDRQVMIDYPDLSTRRKIFDIHGKNKNFSKDVDFDHWAKSTPNFTGASIANLLNEAAIIAVRHKRSDIINEDINEAMDKSLLGATKKDNKLSSRDKWRLAYHEAAHALAGNMLSDGTFTQKVTIIGRGHAAGYAIVLPKKESFIMTKKQLMEQIVVKLAGREAEKIVFGDTSSGAADDISSATKISRRMVTEFGMSELGPIQYEESSGSVFLGRDYNQNKNYSDLLAAKIDEQVRKIVEDCSKAANKILVDNKDKLISLSKILFEKETLYAKEISEVIGVENVEEEDNFVPDFK